MQHTAADRERPSVGVRQPDALAARADEGPRPDPLSPADRYQELFADVQRARVFADSKTFVDCAPRGRPDDILAEYRARRATPGFDLVAFVHARFRAERPPDSHYVSDPDQSLVDHIDGLWPVLTRQPREHPPFSTLLPLPEQYVVPGGRFGEMYYWDSYFTMLGLAESGRRDLLVSMADNFAYLVDTCGHIPNGNRSYYLSRSQPPVFSLMVELFEAHALCRAVSYLPRLKREHAFWMDGADELRRDDADRHVVRLPDGALLNRYWDARDIPREEAWLEDETTARRSRRPAAEVYRELRSAAASGWDFSSRWCDEDGDLATTRTTTILPVDLNAFLFKLEAQIAQLSRVDGDARGADEFGRRARARRAAIDRWLWDERLGAFVDYDRVHDRRRAQASAAIAVPLFVGLATPDQAHRVARALHAHLLEPGGLATSCRATGEQWDQPNGWAPLQWMAISGLRRYGEEALACDISARWLDTVGSLYERESKLVEKYVLEPTPEGAVGGGGGEYPLQDGFGWTNGVTRRLLHQEPDNRNHQARAGRNFVHQRYPGRH
ncbi:MAG TPA: alpha,alpha-trehalase TreF [Xanthomonadaceae bacterium]|nr:alpha,alpha-trehalase TreF [Xanthomonadaceae bacterium]